MNWLDRIRPALAARYREIVDTFEEDKAVGDLVVLYAWPSVEERNATHEMDAYLPSHVTIGNDSGGMEFLIRRDGSNAVFQCEAGALGSMEPETVHPDVGRWIADGCPLPEEEDDENIPDLPLNAPIWLIRAPGDGLKGMLALRSAMAQSWPVSELRSMMTELPCLLTEMGQPYRIRGKLRDSPALLGCLACGNAPDRLLPLHPGGG